MDPALFKPSTSSFVIPYPSHLSRLARNDAHVRTYQPRAFSFPGKGKMPREVVREEVDFLYAVVCMYLSRAASPCLVRHALIQ